MIFIKNFQESIAGGVIPPLKEWDISDRIEN